MTTFPFSPSWLIGFFLCFFLFFLSFLYFFFFGKMVCRCALYSLGLIAHIQDLHVVEHKRNFFIPNNCAFCTLGVKNEIPDGREKSVDFKIAVALRNQAGRFLPLRSRKLVDLVSSYVQFTRQDINSRYYGQRNRCFWEHYV